jgi:hypothetical protein
VRFNISLLTNCFANKIVREAAGNLQSKIFQQQCSGSPTRRVCIIILIYVLNVQASGPKYYSFQDQALETVKTPGCRMLHRAFVLLSSSCGLLLMWCQIVIQAQAASSTIAHPFLQTSSNFTSVLPPIGNRLF